MDNYEKVKEIKRWYEMKDFNRALTRANEFTRQYDAEYGGKDAAAIEIAKKILKSDFRATLNDKGEILALNAYIDFSRENWVSWDALIETSAEAQRTDKRCPQELKDWMADVLQGKLTSPSRISGRNITRNMMIVALVDHLAKEFNLNPTRNDATEPEISACDVVAIAFGLAFETVKDIYKARG